MTAAEQPRYARCPKCGSTTLVLIEVHEEIGATDPGRHEVVNGGIIPAGQFHFEPGDPVRLLGECDGCGHDWQMRGRLVIA